MSFRTIHALGLSLAFISLPAYAQDDDGEAEAKGAEAAKPAEKGEPDEAAPSGSAGLSAAAKADASGVDASAKASADAQAAATADGHAGGRPPVFGKRGDWSIDPYGYARFDAIIDSTQSFDDGGIQPNLIQRVGTYRGDHRRTTFSARDSRLGVQVAAPVFAGIKSSGVIEFDFYGLAVTDAKKHDQVVYGPLRLRHAYLKMETAFIDVVAGQYYDVFGWGSTFYPATVAYLGVPGEIYHRNPQLRLEKKLSAGLFDVTVAAAAVRPGQRDSGGVPDAEAGLKVAFNGWTGIATPGFGRPAVAPLSIGLSGLYRHFEVPVFNSEPGSEHTSTNGYGFAAQALLPVVPATSLEDKGNSLTVTGELSVGSGIADMYTGMDGGSRFPLLPNPSMIVPEQAYPQNIDGGLVTFDRTFAIKSIDWRAIVIGAQYYLPIGNGRVWLSGVYSQVWSDNIKELTPAPSWGAIFTEMEYIDANLGFDITPALAVGLSFQTVKQTFGDVSAATPNYGAPFTMGQPGSAAGIPGTGGVPATARNNRGQLSMALFF